MTPRLLSLSLAALTASGSFSARAADSFEPARLEKEVLVPGCSDAVQLECLSDGRILFVEFAGGVKIWDPSTKLVSTLGVIPTYAKGEVGLLGFAADRDFLKTGHLYALFCPSARTGSMRVSRFTVKENQLDAASERVLLQWDYDTEHVYHMGGAMWMDSRGDLYIGNGDNCHWNPGLPVDPRPGKKSWDAQRSAANSKDLRGKILRIHPNADGKYDIPSGNLFADSKDGAPEVYCMGIRNPYRVTVDDLTGTLYIGDVGANVLPELRVHPVGYEEINATRTAANFGWPYFVGPNEALPLFDFDAGKEIRRQSPGSPKNESPNNTGLVSLPEAKAALIWYSSVSSKEFPSVGSGGRSVMAGPVYHFDKKLQSSIRLPEHFDGKLFVYEWMRNWIQVADVTKNPPTLEPFLGAKILRRPIDMKVGPDGALYMIEYGDQWWGNKDSQISRVVYRRGNRNPAARLSVPETAGRAPFQVLADASYSSDPDAQKLRFTWSVDGKNLSESGPVLKHTLEVGGSHEIAVTVTDPLGASATEKRTVFVGNARPVVEIVSPENGSFFDWGKQMPFRLRVRETDGDLVREQEAVLQAEFRTRHFSGEGASAEDPGLAAMRASTCFSCHGELVASAGPSYRDVALKYQGDKEAALRLTKKIASGGAGVWGQVPMPPHPQHTEAEIRGMVQWILSLSATDALPVSRGVSGSFLAPQKPGEASRTGEGILVVKALYTDDGKGGTLPRLQGEKTIVLHSRRKKAALCDENFGAALVEQVEGEIGLIGRFPNGAHIIFKDINLRGITRAVVRAGNFKQGPAVLELRKDGPRGPLLASLSLASTGEGKFEDTSAAIDSSELLNLCVVARCADGGEAGLNWIEFQ